MTTTVKLQLVDVLGLPLDDRTIIIDVFSLDNSIHSQATVLLNGIPVRALVPIPNARLLLTGPSVRVTITSGAALRPALLHGNIDARQCLWGLASLHR